MQKKNSDVRGL